MHSNADPAEIGRFNALAARWWDPDGDFRPLHAMNPVRVDYICRRAPPAGLDVLDVGCGGGLLAEALWRRGARVTGIDLAEGPLEVARLHARESAAEVNYLRSSAEALAAERPGSFDLVTCLEMLEHVPDPASVVAACAQLVRPGGQLFFSTINRNPKAFATAIVGAEYLLRLLPKGTHEYAKLIRPSELAGWIRAAGLELQELTGLRYNPISGRCSLAANVDVNYLAHVVRPDASA